MSSSKESLLISDFKKLILVRNFEILNNSFYLALYQESKEVIVEGREKPLLEVNLGRSRLAFKIDNGILSGEFLSEDIK